MTQITSRRERLRAATVQEIKGTARRLLVQDGVGGISLRAIGRDMGMTAAALYRYYPNLEALVTALCADFFDECRAAMEQARDQVRPDQLSARMYAISRAFRRWSVAHPAEFGLMFGTPLPGLSDPAPAGGSAHQDGTAHPDDCKHQAAQRFAAVFAEVFTAIWRRAPFDVPADEALPPALAAQLRRYVEEIGAPLPLGAMQVFLSCWIRLYGLVAMEVFGHIRFALTDVEPMFEVELATAARLLGLEPQPAPPAEAPAD